MFGILPLDVLHMVIEMVGGGVGEDLWKSLSNLDVATCNHTQRIFCLTLLSSPFLPTKGSIEVTPHFPYFLVWLHNRNVHAHALSLRFGGVVNWNIEQVRGISLPTVTHFGIDESEPCQGIVDEMVSTSRAVLQMCPSLTSVSITGAARDRKIYHTALLTELRNFPGLALSHLTINASINNRVELNLLVQQFHSTLTTINLAGVTIEHTTFKALEACSRLSRASLMIGACSEEELTELFSNSRSLRELTIDFEGRPLPLPAVIEAILASQVAITALTIYHPDREAFASFARLLSGSKARLSSLSVCGNEYTQATSTLAVCGVLCPLQLMQILDGCPEQSLRCLQVFRHGVNNLTWNVWDTALTRFGHNLHHVVLHESSAVTGTMLPSANLAAFLSRLPALRELTLSLSYFISLEKIDQVLAEACTQLRVVELKCFPMHEQELMYFAMRCPGLQRLKLMMAGSLAPYAKWRGALQQLGYAVDLTITSP